MRKILVCTLISALVLGVTACGTSKSSNVDKEMLEASVTENTINTKSSITPEETETMKEENNNTSNSDSNILIAYFTWADNTHVDNPDMKSAEMYPEYQGDPGNIQFLTRAEHLEAHKGSWRNPTNWYFNPVTKEKVDFGDGPFIPCKIISLSEPVVKSNIEVESNANCSGSKEEIQSKLETTETNPASGNKPSRKIRPKRSVESKVTPPPRKKNIFIGGLKKTGRFIAEHPVEAIEIAGVVLTGTIKAISSIRGKGTSSISRNTSEVKPTNTIEKVIEKASRNLPSENDVSGHKQRYHTKNGVVWKDKAPYHRGGNK